MSDFDVNLTPASPINVTVNGGVGPQGPQGPAGAGGVSTLQGLAGALTLAAVGGSWSASGSTITLTVTGGGSVAWADITGKPSTFTPSTHTHTIADVTGLQTALDGKQASGSYAAASHTHTASAVTDFSSAALSAVTWSTLTGKPTFATVATTGAYSDLTGLPTIPPAYTLPAATVSTLGGVIVGSGLSVTSGTVSANVTSVAGRTGAVTIAAGDVSGLASVATAGTFASLTSKPTTLSGYGITDGVVTTDSRLSDTRTPTAGSVTDASITSGGLSTTSINWAAITAWAPSTSYAKGDLVEYLGVAYRRSVAGTSGTTFSVANWQQTTPTSFVASQITNGTVAVARLPVVLEQGQAIGSSGSTKTLSLGTGSVQTMTLSANCTVTMPTATANASITLILTQGASVYTCAFTGVKWPGGTAPTITATANAVDILVFVSDGTNWYGTAAQKFS